MVKKVPCDRFSFNEKTEQIMCVSRQTVKLWEMADLLTEEKTDNSVFNVNVSQKDMDPHFYRCASVDCQDFMAIVLFKVIDLLY